MCDLQSDHKRTNLSFYWSQVFEKYSFLPRVVYHNIILSKARWRIEREEIKKVTQSGEMDSVSNWLESRKIPQWVQIVEGDNKLLLNLLNEECLSLLKDHCKAHPSVLLEEFLFGEELIVKEGQQGFANQLIISFYNQEKLLKSQKSD